LRSIETLNLKIRVTLEQDVCLSANPAADLKQVLALFEVNARKNHVLVDACLRKQSILFDLVETMNIPVGHSRFAHDLLRFKYAVNMKNLAGSFGCRHHASVFSLILQGEVTYRSENPHLQRLEEPMKTLNALVIMTASLFGTFAMANDVLEFPNAKVVLLQPATIQAIQTAIAKPGATTVEKATAVLATLALEASAADGFCATVVKTYANDADRPKSAVLAKNCPAVLADVELANQIVRGDLAKDAPKGQDLRTTLSQAISGYIVLLSMGGF
jgi:hypothetical protein